MSGKKQKQDLYNSMSVLQQKNCPTFSLVNKIVKTNSWHLPQGASSLVRDALNLKATGLDGSVLLFLFKFDLLFLKKKS